MFDRLSSALDEQLVFHDTLSLTSFLTAFAKMHSHTQSVVPTVQLGCKYTASQIHDRALCSFLSYDFFLYLNIFPELRGFIDLVINRLRHPSPHTHPLFTSSFTAVPLLSSPLLSSPLLSSLIPYFISTLPPTPTLSLPFSLPWFLPSSLSLSHSQSLNGECGKARPPVGGKKGRDHQLADGGM